MAWLALKSSRKYLQCGSTSSTRQRPKGGYRKYKETQKITPQITSYITVGSWHGAKNKAKMYIGSSLEWVHWTLLPCFIDVDENRQ
jgi:hypothetical protein